MTPDDPAFCSDGGGEDMHPQHSPSLLPPAPRRNGAHTCLRVLAGAGITCENDWASCAHVHRCLSKETPVLLQVWIVAEGSR